MHDTSVTSAPDDAQQQRRPARPRSRGRLVALVVGLAMLLTGLGLLTYVGWEYYGTNIIAKRKHEELRQEIRERWRHATVSDLLGPQASVPLGSADALVRIPRFGSDYEVPLVEGVRGSDLEQGIGHFPGTGPGQIGNFALAGHRVTHGEPFRDLPDLRPGDDVIVETAAATYTYVTDTDPNDLVVSFTDTWVLDEEPIAPDGEAPPGMPTFGSPEPTRAIITLTTCSELFHTDNRLVAFGHLVSTVPK